MAGSRSEWGNWRIGRKREEEKAEISFIFPKMQTFVTREDPPALSLSLSLFPSLSFPLSLSHSLPPLTCASHQNETSPRIKSGLKGAGLSILLGYAAAALIKTVGKTVALLLVAAYTLSSYLSHKKFLSVDWEGLFKKAGSKATWLLDIDRDGSIGIGDVKAAVNKASRLVGRTKLSSGAAFIVGLAWGLGVLPTPI